MDRIKIQVGNRIFDENALVSIISQRNSRTAGNNGWIDRLHCEHALIINFGECFRTCGVLSSVARAKISDIFFVSNFPINIISDGADDCYKICHEFGIGTIISRNESLPGIEQSGGIPSSRIWHHEHRIRDGNHELLVWGHRLNVRLNSCGIPGAVWIGRGSLEPMSVKRSTCIPMGCSLKGRLSGIDSLEPCTHLSDGAIVLGICHAQRVCHIFSVQAEVILIGGACYLVKVNGHVHGCSRNCHAFERYFKQCSYH